MSDDTRPCPLAEPVGDVGRPTRSDTKHAPPARSRADVVRPSFIKAESHKEGTA